MIQKKKLILSRTQENVDIMTRRLTRDIFMTKDAIWDDMLPLLLILSRCELGSWNKFISWNFLYLGTFYDKGRYIRRYFATSIEWDCVLN